MIYYDDLENLIKDIEDSIKQKIVLNKNEKIIELTKNEFLKYNEEHLPLRSFSKPYFMESQLKLEYFGFDNELKKKIEAICLAYTDKEINAIIDAMPVLKDYSSKNKGKLNNVAIIWRDHFLEENVGLLTSFVRMGVQPKNILAIDKGDSTKHRFEITETFKKLGFNVNIIDNTDVENTKLMKDGKKIITDFIERRQDKKIVILDDGAIISKILDVHTYDNIIAIVELTEMGLRRIKGLNVDELAYPVFNVAKTSLKRVITYKEISNTIFTRSIELLGGEKLVGRLIIQLGYGDLGASLAERYRQYGANVTIVDPDVIKRIEAAENGFTTFETLDEAIEYEKPFFIVGASGYQSISREIVNQLNDGTFITSGATADISIFKEFEKEGCKYNYIPKYGTQYQINGKKITVLGNGRSVNLFDSEAIPNRSNDIFKAGTLVTVDNIINSDAIMNRHVELDLVEKWIRQSKILEKYYELYLKKGR